MNTITFIFFFFLLFFLLLNTHFLFLIVALQPKNQLQRGSSIKVEDASSNVLISLDGTFTCGFYTFNETTNAFYFSIWYTNSAEKTVVWTANREKPVNSGGSRVTLGENGALVLSDIDGSNVWETNTTSIKVDKVELLNSGSLVLKDFNGKVIWQSFDFPTDTLLPTQLFSMNLKLVSRRSPLDFSFGYYSFFFDNDNALKLMYDDPEISSIYWPDPGNRIFQNGRTKYNNSRVAILDDNGTFISSDLLQFRAVDFGVGVKRRLTMDHDGNLRLYSLNYSTGLWLVTWLSMVKQCDIHGVCGKNGICTYTPEPRCSCLPHFEPFDSSDLRKGCKPSFHRSSNDSQFLEVFHVDFYGYNLNSTQNITFEDCKELCLGDYRCQAFKYIMRGTMKCYTKSALFNGYTANASLHIRLPINIRTPDLNTTLKVSQLDCKGTHPKINHLRNTYDSSSHTFKWVYVYVFGGIIGVIEVIIFVTSWCFLFSRSAMSSSLEQGYRTISSQFRSFSFSELKKATQNFNHVLGIGGFGKVYKGVLADDREIAVKKLGNFIQGEEEFWAEVSTLGRINHMNLARIWGFCSQKKHKLLVYEFVENGSLDKHLFDSSNPLLDWQKRFKIALGTAKGLAYLHHECLEWVIHCDVKPENILLDCNFEPKISDFGLSKLCQRGNHGLSKLSKIRGTKGYMAPEWTTNLPLTSKVDVYSYGIVILELVRGSRLSSCDDGDEVFELKSFVTLVKEKVGGDYDESWIEGFVDSRLEGKFNKKQASKMIEIGVLCIEDDRNKRPTMESIAQNLAECEDEIMQCES